MKETVWNESRVYKDPVTLRTVRQITTKGMLNSVPSYHTNQAFTEDGEYVIFTTIREGRSMLCKAQLETGDITCLIDPVDGMGGWNEIGSFGNGKGIALGSIIEPKSRWAYYIVEREIRGVNIDTLEEKIVVDDIGEEYYIDTMAVSPDEKRLVYVVRIQHPEKHGGLKYHICSKVMGEKSTILFGEEGVSGGHVMFHPVDSDLFLFCKDKGPSPAHRIDEHSRNWIYCISRGTFTEVKTVEKQNFQTHSTWTWDGTGIVYHGMIGNSDWKYNINDKGWYIGVTDLNGEPVREYSFPEANYYGHVSAMPRRNAAILDGNLLDGLLMWISFDHELPKIEIIAQHNTDFTTMPGQYSHPHAIADPTGRWIVYNSAPKIIFTGARSDIYLVTI